MFACIVAFFFSFFLFLLRVLPSSSRTRTRTCVVRGIFCFFHFGLDFLSPPLLTGIIISATVTLSSVLLMPSLLYHSSIPLSSSTPCGTICTPFARQPMRHPRGGCRITPQRIIIFTIIIIITIIIIFTIIRPHHHRNATSSLPASTDWFKRHERQRRRE